MQADKALEGLKTKLEELKKALDITPDLRFKIKHRLLKFPDIDQVYKHYQSFGNQMDNLIRSKTNVTRLLRSTQPTSIEQVTEKLEAIKILTDSIHQMYGSAQIVQQCILQAHVKILENAKSHLTEVKIYFQEAKSKVYSSTHISGLQFRCEELVLKLYDDLFPGMMKQFPFIALSKDFVDVKNLFGIKDDIDIIDVSEYILINNESYKKFIESCCTFLDFTDQKLGPIHDKDSPITAACFEPNAFATNLKQFQPSTLFKTFTPKGENKNFFATPNDAQCIPSRKLYDEQIAPQFDKQGWSFQLNIPKRLIQFKKDREPANNDSEKNITVKDNQLQQNPSIIVWTDAHLAFTEFLKNTYTYIDHIITKRINTKQKNKPFNTILVLVNVSKDYKLNKTISEFVESLLHVEKYDGSVFKEASFKELDKKESKAQPEKLTDGSVTSGPRSLNNPTTLNVNKTTTGNKLDAFFRNPSMVTGTKNKQSQNAKGIVSGTKNGKSQTAKGIAPGTKNGKSQTAKGIVPGTKNGKS